MQALFKDEVILSGTKAPKPTFYWGFFLFFLFDASNTFPKTKFACTFYVLAYFQLKIVLQMYILLRWTNFFEPTIQCFTIFHSELRQ